MKRIFAATVIFLAIGASAKSDRFSINDSWEFRLPSDTLWTRVHLPHTYNLDAYEKLDYYRGKALYRRSLSIDSLDPAQRYFIKVDAASKKAEVKFNNNIVGTHPGGYTAFTYDITDYLQPENEIEILTDNDAPDVAPISADFTFWGGIYRDVWLIQKPLQHFNMLNHGADGAVFVSTPSVSEETATVEVRSEVTNSDDKLSSLLLATEIISPEGKVVGKVEKKIKLAPGSTESFTLTSDRVNNPLLWSPDTPNLYTVTTTLSDPKTGKEIDRHSTRIGLRWWSFDSEKGFSLNGKPMKLRGFNRHQDQAPFGVALPDEAHRRDMKLMKDLGANFIRIAHYPQDDAILDAADELGILAWEEIPIVNIVEDTPGFADNCELNLREMIRQHYNHPSVIAWGYMNEILLVTPGSNDERWPAYRDRTVNLARRLESTLKNEDPARTSFMAFSASNRYNEVGLDLEDVVGWNLYQGWYGGELSGFDEFCEDQHRRYPAHPIMISEWGAGSDRRLHSDNEQRFDFSTDYQQKYVEHYLDFIEKTPWICGGTYWNFIDFNVAARQESMPRTNNKGVFYNDRSPKDVTGYFKAMWHNPDSVPVVYIASRDIASRLQTPDSLHKVKVYSNLPEIELIVDGVSTGIKNTQNCNAVFNIPFSSGNSIIEAKGYTSDGKKITDAMVITIIPVTDPGSGDFFAVNVGSNCYFTSDLSGLTWLPDEEYSEERGYGHTGGKIKSTTSEIFNSADCGPVYQTSLAGQFTYRIDAPEGEYEVELYMADTSRPAPALANLLDKAKEEASDVARCDIEINGQKVETDFTPATGGYYQTAFRRKYLIDNNDGAITVSIHPKEGDPSLSGIKIRKKY